MLKARDVMTRKVVTVKKDLTLRELSNLFLEHRVNGFPVVDDDSVLIGVVTEKDLIEQNKNLHIPTVIALFDAVIYLESDEKFEKEVKRFTGTRVEDIFQQNVLTVEPDTDMNEVATLMANHDIHTLPVVEGGKLVGVIGKVDVIKCMSEF
ncbi:CBS domain containing membrane protein [Nitrospina gracilis 3/211]|uniref:CBS domain containing membrane protein n=1 Tax=Nitrospina gracilis (strain 3/211) TaxID=1266370 RepID=M1YLM7_NITG3|nr:MULTISPECIES: CBS domain-containing protein [Nitrospina]MCF8724236.1 CBS-domain-containing membrane protein [Nitrospina sp. Nb-3]CCQ91382.1 CBS domain containing membrane protein [Nitrospina gracilis 3/211]